MPLTFTEADFTEAGPDAGNFTEADFEEGFTARLGNALKSFPKALADSTGGSIRGGARAADMVREQELLTSLPTGTATPTARQSRRAFEQALTSPEYQSRLTLAGEDPAAAARVEELYGPAAKLGVIRAPIDAARSASATDATTRQARLEQSPTYQYGQAVSDVAREVYPTRADLDDKAESQILRALGGTAPSVALGLVPFVGPPAAVAQYGLAAGEQGAQEAVAAGRPETADIAFLANAGLGAASEAALGVAPRLLRITRAARLSGIAPEKFKTTLDVWAKANPIKASALEVAIREGAQESVEQAGQNVIARDVAGYDPDRPYSKEVCGRACWVQPRAWCWAAAARACAA